MTVKSRTHEPIPADWPVKVVPPGTKGEDIVTDGYCGLSWDDSIVTDYTPAPSARCPFEDFHLYPEDDEQDDSPLAQIRDLAMANTRQPNDDWSTVYHLAQDELDQ